MLDARGTAGLAARAPRAHLDGARLPNAAVALGVPLGRAGSARRHCRAEPEQGALARPFGAILAGDGETIAGARVHLKRLGGGTVHKAGILAAAGLVAIERMLGRLADDHARARELAALIGARRPRRTSSTPTCGPGAVEALRSRGVLALELEGRVRFVTHRLIGDDEIRRRGEVVASVARQTERGQHRDEHPPRRTRAGSRPRSTSQPRRGRRAGLRRGTRRSRGWRPGREAARAPRAGSSRARSCPTGVEEADRKSSTQIAASESSGASTSSKTP